MSVTSELSISALSEAVQTAIALRVITNLEPAGGPGDKLFPPTYAGGQYHLETRRVGEAEVQTVVLDSVQSQANRMELALLAARDRGEVSIPLIVADFSKELPHIGKITALDAPHRIADAIFRDSLFNGLRFRDSEPGRRFTSVSTRNATALLELCPTALVFGVWDSTGPRGGLGAKFARALVSEIVGYDAVIGYRTGSRIDPLPVARRVEIFSADEGGWTLDPDHATKNKKGEPETVRPSELNLGNVTPDLARDERRRDPLPGGVTVSRAVQTTVLSLAGLRKLGFPVNGDRTEAADTAARTLLAALAVAAMSYQRAQGYDLRSRCLLVPTAPMAIELVPADGSTGLTFAVEAKVAGQLVADAAEAVTAAGLPWSGEDIVLEPEAKLVELVKRSETVLSESSEPDEEDAAS